MGRRELGRGAEAAVFRVVRPHKLRACLPGQGRAGVRFGRGRRGGDALSAPQQRQDLVRRAQELFPPVRPPVRNRPEQAGKARHPVPGVRRKVRAGVKRALVRRHEHAHGPAAAAGKRLAKRHVHAVDIRAFLPVHLDGNKMFVEYGRGLFIRKALARHDMAPVAGAVADAQEHRLVLFCRAFKSLSAPGIPIHRIVRMLQQIRAGRILEPIGHCITSSKIFCH